MRIAFAVMCSFVATSVDAVHLEESFLERSLAQLDLVSLRQAAPDLKAIFEEKDAFGNDTEEQDKG